MSTDDSTGAYDFGTPPPGDEGGHDGFDDGIPTTFTPSAESYVHDGPRDVGLVFIGDGFVSGYGDPKGLGWVSRVLGRTSHPDLDLSAYNLGVRGECSADVLERWKTEGMLRWQERRERRVVIGVGQNDVLVNLTTARSRLNLANVLDDATARGIAPFVVGPPPTLDPQLNNRLEVIVEAQSDVCARRSVPFVDCFYPLVEHDQWLSDLGASRDQRHPGQAGYGLLAWLVLHGGWENWLQIGG